MYTKDCFYELLNDKEIYYEIIPDLILISNVDSTLRHVIFMNETHLRHICNVEQTLTNMWTRCPRAYVI